jgi:GH25 family lysozyme M1 (1,4-beta-N-acetylmuramidase)
MTLTLADVSEFQRTVNWAAYGAQYPAVVVRVHNSNRPDNYAQPNIAGARAHCKWRGFYQYLTAGADPVKAAHDMQRTLGPTLPGEVMILDLEEGAGDQRARRQAWLDALQDPIEWTYSGMYFARQHLPGVHVEWLAAYGQSEPTDPHTLWQNTNAQRFAGIAAPCDGSIFHGTLATLQTLSMPPTPTFVPPTTDPFQEDPMDRLIVALYRKLIGRTPADSEVDAWLVSAALNAYTAKDVADRIAASPEAKAHAAGK